MDQDIGEKLISIVDALEKNTLLIGTNWIKEVNVKSIFDIRKISRKKFRDSYGVPIINYFISVIRKEKEAGDCPIMSKFVTFMLTKNITPREVFTICMGFRKSLIGFLLKEDIVLKDPLPFMDEVAFIFDANLSGVLEIFSNSYAENQQKIEIAKAQKNKLQQTTKIINSINTKIIILHDTQIILVNKPFLEMTGVDNLKDFYEKYKSGFEFLHDINVYEKDFKENIAQWIEKVCTNNIHFKANIHHEKINQTLSYSGKITKLPAENENQYIIALSNITGHIKDEAVLEDYLSHDEITGFKNYANFEGFLNQKVEDAKEKNIKLFLVITDIINLRELNAQKGRESGDKIISEIAEDLRFIENKNTYFARLEGSRFGILLEYDTEQNAYDWCVSLYNKTKERDATVNIAITEIDFSQSINKLFIRSYSLVEDECRYKLINHDFSDVIEHKELENQEEFTNSLKQIKHIDACIYFMELPVAAKVNIMSTNNESAQILISSKQMEITEVGMSIYFKLGQLNNIVANISKIDDKKNIITINEFKKDTHSPLNRKAFRVQAESDLKAYITYEESDYKIKVLNMNHQCIAIEISRIRNLDLNSLVFLDLLLPISNTKRACKTDATITRINKTPNGYKLVLLCHLDDKNKQTLSQYISEQQMKIIQIMKT